jgi:glycosyltransferase involved in cell wall biosynthesis
MEIKNPKIRIIVVGQTPPPFHGQAVMIEQMLQGVYSSIEMIHVKMSFSRGIDEVGKFSFLKVFHLAEVILKVFYNRIKYNANHLYYPPSGPNRIPFYRDVIVLFFIRPLFRKINFHFHAAGISDLYPRLSPIAKFFFRMSYFHADVGIRLSENSTDDCRPLKIKREFIIPNGIEDSRSLFKQPRIPNDHPVILFVGAVSEKKGVSVLLSAASILKQNGLSFSIKIMGKFESVQFEKSIQNLVEDKNISGLVQFLGVKTGRDKFQEYWQSDIFCFPSFYESESFPVVLLEASSFELPVVSTRWRGIPSIVIDEDNGFLVPIMDEKSLAVRLEVLLKNEQLRRRMGERGRQLYLEKYTLEKFYNNIEHALSSTRK